MKSANVSDLSELKNNVIIKMKNFTDKISESLNTQITYLHNEYYE